jgi:hypothetical protein
LKFASIVIRNCRYLISLDNLNLFFASESIGVLIIHIKKLNLFFVSLCTNKIKGTIHMNSKILISSSVTAILLAACGGGSSSTESEKPLSSATFVDSPVQGLYYSTSSGVTGTTDAAGTFKFSPGDTVSFKFGGSNGLEIATTAPTANSPIFVADLPGGVQVAQVLQSFDTGGSPNTKLDVSKIQNIPAAAANALKAHIDNRGDLMAGQSTIGTAIDAIWNSDAALSAVTRPVPRTAAQVEEHLNSSAVSNLPSKIPPVIGKAVVLVDSQSPTTLNLASFSKTNASFLTLLTEDLVIANGTYTQTSDALSMTLSDIKNLSGAKVGSLDCKQSSTFRANVVGGYKIETTSSGTDCNEPAFLEVAYTLDTGFTKDWAKNKTLKIESTNDYSDSCLPATWMFDANGKVAATYSQACRSIDFTASPTTPIAEMPFVLFVENEKSNKTYVIAKLAGFANQYAVLIYEKNQSDNTYSYRTGEMVKVSVQ